MTKSITALALLGCLLCGDPSSAQSSSPYRVVVNSSSPVSSLTEARVSELFLKKVTQWEQGSKVLPVDQMADSPVRETFFSQLI